MLAGWLTPAPQSEAAASSAAAVAPAQDISDEQAEDAAADEIDPEEAKQAKVTLVEAGPRILGPFDAALAEYYRGHLVARGVEMRTATSVTEVRSGTRWL